MATNSTPLDLEIPDFGTVPVQVNHDQDRYSPVDITHRPPDGQRTGGNETDLRLRFKSDRLILIEDGRSRVPQYAIRKQKVIVVNREQRDGLLNGDWLVGTSDDKQNIIEELRSLTQERISRIISSDCPDPDLLYTLLLDWEEDTSKTFPELLFRDGSGKLIEPISQDNNYLVVSVIDGPHSPPARPPAGANQPLNTQISDYRPATEEDMAHYEKYRVQDNGPAVAVIDTGLKFNLLNRGEENQWPDAYMYRDADGQERRFTLAYQDQADPDCGDDMADNHLGYCSLLSYREQTFIDGIKPLTTTPLPTNYTVRNVVNSPFDDFQLFTESANQGTLLDARHGTSVTAIIQQNGDDAPVLPVKVFDNIGFATLFDALNGFNYVLRRCRHTNIRVVNASWIFGQDNPLLRRKIEQLQNAGVFVIAAAGNEGQTSSRSLDEIPLYPACYSQEFKNVITVTSIRKTYLRPDLLSVREDSLVGKALGHAVRLGLFSFLERADDLTGAVLPTAGYVAVENYSPRFVNVGVVSTFGYFRSPFWKSPIIRGSSFACAFVAGFVIRQLRTRPDLLALLTSGSSDKLDEARQILLNAMSGSDPDENLKKEYVNGGYYLDGYAVD